MKIFRFICVLTCMAILGFAEENIDLAKLSPQQFLAYVREPLRENAWGQFAGRVTYKANSGVKRKGLLRVRVTFTPESMLTQIVLNNNNVYTLEQTHKRGEPVSVVLERPEKETSPTLFDFGIEPTDLTFSFIYWDFLEELPIEQGKVGNCRVIRLKEPGKSRTAVVRFNLKYGFPEQISWFDAGKTEAVRKLELKGAKRHENGLWFIKEMRLDSADWKSMVTFDTVELNEIKR